MYLVYLFFMYSYGAMRWATNIEEKSKSLSYSKLQIVPFFIVKLKSLNMSMYYPLFFTK